MTRIINWNIQRNGLHYNPKLEEEMLDEEFKEFMDGIKDYYTATTSTELLDAYVDIIDAFCDYMFVAVGSIGKGHTCNSMQLRKNYMLTVISHITAKILDINDTEDIVSYAMECVIIANEAKPINKTTGKVVKGDDWKDPKELIKAYVLKKGFDAYESMY